MKYDWRCLKCGVVIEVERRVAEYEVPPQECAQCDNKEDFKRLIHASAIDFITMRDKGILERLPI